MLDADVTFVFILESTGGRSFQPSGQVGIYINGNKVALFLEKLIFEQLYKVFVKNTQWKFI